MKKRIVPLVLSAAMLVSLATSCTNTAENTPSPSLSQTPTPTPSVSAGVEDGYIPAPYTVSSEDELTAKFLEPVFYENEDGPTIGVTLLGVIVEDGKYFRDLDNDQELDDFEDWRLDAETRAAAMAAAMTDTQLTHQLVNVMAYSPLNTATADAIDENGEPVWTKIFPAVGGFGGGSDDANATNIEYLDDSGIRTFVLRNSADTEVAVWFNNGLEQYSEYDAVANGEVAVPFFAYTNPDTQAHGIPIASGMAAAALGDGNADAILEDTEYHRQVLWAKGIDGLYGPQIDLVTDPRWSRNNTTYGERVDMAEEIAANLVIGYQNGDQGIVEGSVLVTVKHFPGDGAAYNGFESHGYTGRYRLYSTENSLANYQLKPFIAAFEAGAAGVMPGYSQPSDDPRNAPQSITYNGETYDILLGGYGNAFNEDVQLYLLREVLGFDGLINSDSLGESSSHGVSELSSYERMVLFVKAGCDAGVIGFDDGAAPSVLLDEALAAGDVTRADLERAAANRLKPQMQSGNLENPYRDLEESVAAVEKITPEMDALAAELQLKSVVLMKNTDAALPLNDTSVKVYVHGFNQNDDADVSGMISALESAGYTVVEDYNEADVAYLRVSPTIEGQGSSNLAILDLVEDVETPIYDNNAKRTDDTALVTTVASMDVFQEIADTVHANGGKVIGEINASNAWILTNMEPYCDALIGTFGSSDRGGTFSTDDSAIAQVVAGAYNPTGKLPITMVADASVIALVETELEGEMWDVCVSPNDVPGYEKEQYMDADVLAQSPSGSYAYQDANGNFYWSGFGLSY